MFGAQAMQLNSGHHWFLLILIKEVPLQRKNQLLSFCKLGPIVITIGIMNLGPHQFHDHGQLILCLKFLSNTNHYVFHFLWTIGSYITTRINLRMSQFLSVIACWSRVTLMNYKILPVGVAYLSRAAAKSVVCGFQFNSYSRKYDQISHSNV